MLSDNYAVVVELICDVWFSSEMTCFLPVFRNKTRPKKWRLSTSIFPRWKGRLILLLHMVRISFILGVPFFEINVDSVFPFCGLVKYVASVFNIKTWVLHLYRVVNKGRRRVFFFLYAHSLRSLVDSHFDPVWTRTWVIIRKGIVSAMISKGRDKTMSHAIVGVVKGCSLTVLEVWTFVTHCIILRYCRSGQWVKMGRSLPKYGYTRGYHDHRGRNLTYDSRLPV